MRATPALVWLLLTKRPGNIIDQCAEAGGLPPNAAIGCTVVTQDEVTRDVCKLTTAKAALSPLFAFLSIEPMLSEIDLYRGGFSYLSRLTSPQGKKFEKVDWVIVGGMSGDKWRDHEVPVEWVRALRNQCEWEGTPFYFKQWSAYRAKGRGCTLDGREHKERPSVAPLPRAPGPPPAPTQPELFAA
jgi:protein gp37